MARRVAPSPHLEDRLSGWCRQCGYSLRGLPDPRCPECGQGFDPTDPQTIDFRPGLRDRLDRPVQWLEEWLPRIGRALGRRLRPLVPLGLCVLAAWMLYEASPFPFLFWTPALLLVLQRRWASLAALALLTPPTVYVASFSVDYVTGSPRYVSYGMVYSEKGSIDPITRVRRRNSGGCGNRPMNDGLQRLFESTAETLMFRLTGPPPGAYTGPYPTRAEVNAALASATPFDMPDDWDGVLNLPTGKVTFDVAWFHCRWQLNTPSTSNAQPGALRPRAVMWKGPCLIVKVPRDTIDGRWSEIYLIDTQTPELFAMYMQPGW